MPRVCLCNFVDNIYCVVDILDVLTLTLAVNMGKWLCTLTLAHPAVASKRCFHSVNRHWQVRSQIGNLCAAPPSPPSPPSHVHEVEMGCTALARGSALRHFLCDGVDMETRREALHQTLCPDCVTNAMPEKWEHDGAAQWQVLSSSMDSAAAELVVTAHPIICSARPRRPRADRNSHW